MNIRILPDEFKFISDMFIRGDESIINPQDTILTNYYDYVFVKKSTVFWEYKNVVKPLIAARETTGWCNKHEPWLDTTPSMTSKTCSAVRRHNSIAKVR